MLSRRSQIARLRAVALAALASYALPDGRLTFVTHGENTTFRHESAAGRFLVRVHRLQRHGQGVDAAAAIDSEISWLRAIRADTDLDVPEPLHTRDGDDTVVAAAAGESRVCSVLRWMDGRIYEESARPVHLRRLGEAMAVLHHQADVWTPPPGFVRIAWDHDTFFGDVMVYGDITAGECWRLLPAAVRARFESVAVRLADIMAADRDVGLIHADLHPGNAVFDGERVKLIDFDDCGTGPRLYELAVAVWEFRLRPDYPAYLAALQAGYLGRRTVDLTAIDDYIALRQVAFALWCVGMARVNPEFAARLDGSLRWSLAMLDACERR
ncbi:phosphotransferase [Microbacterium sp. NEAU-LLC]|uniref:Phosphotransferase n=1 Tax=Microbacterium helvum TaxID=2773713 RepID=A0ABR8NQ02_9MICO|nr:phosphotransferase [Microbacterium helvum]MBD3942732.1 phosphotransferase [Microbacterium helvum]